MYLVDEGRTDRKNGEVHIKGLHNCYFAINIFNVQNSRFMRLKICVACMDRGEIYSER
jgi:hypothetical protein